MLAWAIDRRPEDDVEGLKKEVVIVPAWPGNRDAGRHYLISEMPAARAEKWAWRMFIALKGSGSEIPESVQRMGMVGVAFAGLNAFLRADVSFEKLEPLLDEMMTCVKIVRVPSARDKETGDIVATDIVTDDDIREVQTRGWLRAEVIRLHTNFSLAEALSKIMQMSPTFPDSSIT